MRRRPAGIGARVSPPPRGDPVAALNQVLSEVIDAILDVGQAHRRVPGTHALHAVLDQLSADLRAWAGLLADQDQALGVSPRVLLVARVAGRSQGSAGAAGSGRCAVIVVPLVGTDRTSSRPSRAASLSAMLRWPDPIGVRLAS
jgi:hypothetical protein